MLIKVKTYPQSKKEKVVKKTDDSFEIFVKEKPEQGRVNQKLQKILAKHFGLAEKSVKLIKGHKQKNKIFKKIGRAHV